MKQAAHVSKVHVIVAIVATAVVTSSAVLFLDPRAKEDPFAKSEELRLLLGQFPDEIRQKLAKEINVRDDRYDQLPYDRLERIVTLLEGEPAKIAGLQGDARDQRVEKLLEKIDTRELVPPELRGVGVFERIGAKLPLELQFKDHTGKDVMLGSFFQTGLPVILTLNYSDCPQLCHLQLNNLVQMLHEHKIIPGKGFEIVTVSINPDEPSTKANHARNKYLRALGNSSARWHFLTTRDNETIKALAAAVGFGYRFDPINKDYAHSSTLILCTPAGLVSQYYQGIEYKPDELRKRIASAAANDQVPSGEIDNYFNCKVVDGNRPYALKAARVLKVISAVCAIVLVLTLVILWMIPAKKPDVLPPLQGDSRA
jgi:protein SCO1/2